MAFLLALESGVKINDVTEQWRHSLVCWT